MANLPMNEDGFVTQVSVGTKVFIPSPDDSDLPYIIVEIVGNKVIMYHPSKPMVISNLGCIARHYSVA